MVEGICSRLDTHVHRAVALSVRLSLCLRYCLLPPFLSSLLHPPFSLLPSLAISPANHKYPAKEGSVIEERPALSTEGIRSGGNFGHFSPCERLLMGWGRGGERRKVGRGEETGEEGREE